MPLSQEKIRKDHLNKRQINKYVSAKEINLAKKKIISICKETNIPLLVVNRQKWHYKKMNVGQMRRIFC